MIGIIGGSGLEDPQILQDANDLKMETPYGEHSPIRTGKINGIGVAVLSRHGYKHEYCPKTVPYKANIWLLKELGCKAIVSSSACGSLKEELVPGTISFPDQFIDRTTHREQSFTSNGKVIHASMAEPFSKELRQILVKNCSKLGLNYSAETTLITIEGPRFSTKEESKLFRSWGCDLINMTTVPECCLAKELNVPYQVVNLITDYDCWKDGTEAVTFEEVMKVMKSNAEKVKKLFAESLPEIAEKFK